MSTYVLVHGGNTSTDTWNRISGRDDYPNGGYLGAKCWNPAISTLTAHGHNVFAPTLKPEDSSSLTEHIQQICAVIAGNNLTNIILVGHSYGGIVITGVADKIPERIKLLVYLDAALPEPGQSLYDLLQLGLTSSTGDMPALPDPAPPYVEKLQYNKVTIQALPKIYILCTKSEFIDVTSLAKKKIDADNKGWNYIELDSSHLPMADAPDKLCQVFLDAS
ncbi:MAG: hypothetical protein CSYNP_02105 [Syntrophus sp. SKADARSKE-3]|nr:hypothetical protein [Syntrophus sp. SKADARSKE-3]